MNFCIADEKSLMSIYKKFNIEYSLAKNMFISSNMQYCIADVSSEVNEFIVKVHHRGLIFQKFVQ